MLAGADRRHRPVFSGGAVQLFSFSFLSPPFWGDDFSFSFSGEGNFWGGVFSFWSGEGAFLGVGDMFFFFFTWGGGSKGEKRAFMAEPSARPAINDMLDKKMRCRNEEEKKKHKKKQTQKNWEKKNLALFFQPGQKISAQPGEVVVMRW